MLQPGTLCCDQDQEGQHEESAGRCRRPAEVACLNSLPLRCLKRLKAFLFGKIGGGAPQMNTAYTSEGPADGTSTCEGAQAFPGHAALLEGIGPREAHVSVQGSRILHRTHLLRVCRTCTWKETM